MALKPSVPKGTRDFSPQEMGGRNYIFETIKKVFKLYGYSPIETPAMENLSTLLGKYGEEGDRLIFKILNSGNFLSGMDQSNQNDPAKLSMMICEKGLKYDLTVPFARYVVQNQHEINFPFKRYQIQPVWRADKPQKGRYREFYQCDVDVIGSDSLLNEVELIKIIDDIFKRLKIRTVTKINNRKILTGVSELIGMPEKITDITIAIDKLEKIGFQKVCEELISKGLTEKSIETLSPVLNLQGNNKEKLAVLKKIFIASPTGLKGIEEMEEIFEYTQSLALSSKVELDLTLARGLNYYTGVIIEVKAMDVQIGSICGGGRYDNLTGVFGLPGVSGVGVSFGADRIFDVLSNLDLFPYDTQTSSEVMFVNFGKDEVSYSLNVAEQLRSSGISCELYPDCAKLKRQLSYASQKKIKWVVIAGEEEISSGHVNLKNMETGKQLPLSTEKLISTIKQSKE
jgi:histidyl-tRNA synthetase